MGLNWRGAAAAMAGAGAGLIGDSIKQDRALEQDAVMRERNLADKRSLLGLTDEIEQMKQQRIAAVIGSVPREVDDPTHPEGKRTLSEGEYNRAVSTTLSGRGLIAEGERFERAADRYEDNARQQARDTNERSWREQRAASEDKRVDAQIAHWNAMERAAAGKGSEKAGRLDEWDKTAVKDNETEIRDLRKSILKGEIIDPERQREAEGRIKQLQAENQRILMKAASGGDMTPTQEDIDGLIANYPKLGARAIARYDSFFGEGAAEKILSRHKYGGGEQESPAEPPQPQENRSFKFGSREALEASQAAERGRQGRRQAPEEDASRSVRAARLAEIEKSAAAINSLYRR